MVQISNLGKSREVTNKIWKYILLKPAYFLAHCTIGNNKQHNRCCYRYKMIGCYKYFIYCVKYFKGINRFMVCMKLYCGKVDDELIVQAKNPVHYQTTTFF